MGLCYELRLRWHFSKLKKYAECNRVTLSDATVAANGRGKVETTITHWFTSALRRVVSLEFCLIFGLKSAKYMARLRGRI